MLYLHTNTKQEYLNTNIIFIYKFNLAFDYMVRLLHTLLYAKFNFRNIIKCF